MQIKIQVRVPQVAEALRAKVAAAKPVALKAMADFARDRITAAAMTKLTGFAQTEYIRGLQQADSVRYEEDRAVLRLVGDLPVALEQGAPGYSIKEKMLARTTKRTKDGRPYVDVPFRHGTEEGASQLKGMPSGVASSMKQAVQQAQKALVSTGMSKEGAKMARTRLPGRTSGATITKTVQPGQQKVTTQHKRGIYDDLTRIPHKYGKRIQATYMTIRRISDRSSPSSWMHPGFKAVDIFSGVVAEVQQAAPRIVRDILTKVGL